MRHLLALLHEPRPVLALVLLALAVAGALFFGVAGPWTIAVMATGAAAVVAVTVHRHHTDRRRARRHGHTAMGTL